MTRKTTAYAAWVTVCLVWGTTYLAIRISLETIPPFLMAAFRWMAAGALLTVALSFRKVRLPPPKTWPEHALLGTLMIGVGNGLVSWAEQAVPSGLTAVLIAAIPFWMLAVEELRQDGDQITGQRLVGLLVGFGGIVLLVWPELGLTGGAGAFLRGVIATQIACLGWALGSSYSRRRKGEHVLAAVAVQMLLAGVVLMGVGTVANEWARLGFNLRTASALIYLVCIGSIVGYSAYAYALQHLPVATVSLYAYINPVIAVLLGTLLLDEPITTRIVIAGAIVLVGVGLVRTADQPWLLRVGRRSKRESHRAVDDPAP